MFMSIVANHENWFFSKSTKKRRKINSNVFPPFWQTDQYGRTSCFWKGLWDSISLHSALLSLKFSFSWIHPGSWIMSASSATMSAPLFLWVFNSQRELNNVSYVSPTAGSVSPMSAPSAPMSAPLFPRYVGHSAPYPLLSLISFNFSSVSLASASVSHESAFMHHIFWLGWSSITQT